MYDPLFVVCMFIIAGLFLMGLLRRIDLLAAVITSGFLVMLVTVCDAWPHR